MLCVSVLALVALGDIQDAIGKRGRKIWIQLVASSIVIAAAAIASYVHFVSKVQVQTANYHWANFILAVLWTAAVVAALSGLESRSRRALPMLLVIVAVSDAFLTFQISRETVSSNGPGLAIWKKIDKTHNSSLMLKDLDRRGIFRPVPDNYWHNKNIPMKVASFVNDDTMRNRFQMNFWNHPVLMDMSTGQNRIWFSKMVSVAAPTSDAYEAFVARSEALNNPVLVVHPPQSMREIRGLPEEGLQSVASSDLAIRNLPPAEHVSLRVLRYSPNHLDMTVVCPSAGWLLVTDRWAHGWRARVNGKLAPIFGGNFIFRAVQVQEGANTIEFSYRPIGFPVLLILSWGTLATVLIPPHALRVGAWRVSRSDG